MVIPVFLIDNVFIDVVLAFVGTMLVVKVAYKLWEAVPIN